MLSIESNNKIFEVLNCYREIKVGNRLDFYLQSISNLRRKHSSYTGQLAYLPYVTKYVLESVVVLFALILCSYQFLTKDSIQAISTLVIFIAAGTRMAPAVLRMQQSVISIKTYLGVCKPTLELAKVLNGVKIYPGTQVIPSFTHHGFVPEIIMDKVDFSYGDQSTFRLNDINLKIDSGNFVAIVGPTGSGKSTFADLILGIQNKSRGQTLISGIESPEALKKWPGAVGYVPQDVFMASGSIRENVAIGFDPEFISDENIWEALDAAQLSTFVRTLPEELSSKIGEGGARLSGGQQQRIGIARALFTKPKILILDEATSSLDAETEEAISVAINKLQGQVTLIVIAHRLSTVKSADSVIYFENGRILAEGKFEDVRRNVPNFDKQAKLMGL
jgi:ABC-type bacteriocin/lantibiotic exporter with double-glycine peptidase domain